MEKYRFTIQHKSEAGPYVHHETESKSAATALYKTYKSWNLKLLRVDLVHVIETVHDVTKEFEDF